MSETQHKVKSGDCLSSIAKLYGLTWQQLWDYGPNAGLKALRKDPNIICPGDIVKLPPKKQKDDSKGVDGTHRYVRKSEQSHIAIVLKVDGEPIQDKPCRLCISGLPDRSGNVNSSGEVEIDGSKKIRIPSDVSTGELIVGEGNGASTYVLLIGRLEPHDTIVGVQQRLNNLGYHSGPEDGIVGPITAAATRFFQGNVGIDVDGIPGPITQGKLKETHGS
jgi:hypothetical protein